MRLAGIYSIRSIMRPERFYIGSSIDLDRRWIYHRRDLRGSSHVNAKLQNHYNKYGESDLVFMVLFNCDPSEIIFFEQMFIDNHNPFFNISKTAGDVAMINVGRKHTKEHNDKISKSQQGESNSMYGADPWNKGQRGLQKSPFKGKSGRYSKEALEKMSASSKRQWAERKLKTA